MNFKERLFARFRPASTLGLEEPLPVSAQEPAPAPESTSELAPNPVLTAIPTLPPVQENLGLELPASPVIDLPQMTPQPARKRSSRPPVAAFKRTMELLADNPDSSAAELAATLDVSLSYARTLLRRARSQPSGPVAAALERVQPLPSQPVAESAADLQSQIANLSTRLEEAGRVLAAVGLTPPEFRGIWRQNCRAEILRLHGMGESPASIAARLSIPSGDVTFVLKVESLIVALV